MYDLGESRIREILASGEGKTKIGPDSHTLTHVTTTLVGQVRDANYALPPHTLPSKKNANIRRRGPSHRPHIAAPAFCSLPSETNFPLASGKVARLVCTVLICWQHFPPPLCALCGHPSQTQPNQVHPQLPCCLVQSVALILMPELISFNPPLGSIDVCV